MSCEQTTFSFVVVKMQREETQSQTKEVVANVYGYFEEVSRRQRTHGPLKGISDATGISCTSIKKLLIVVMTNSSRYS